MESLLLCISEFALIITSLNGSYWPFVRGIHRWPVNSPHKGQWCGALMFSLIYTWTHGWANNRDAGGLRRHCVHYDVTVMCFCRRNLCYGFTAHMTMTYTSQDGVNSGWRGYCGNEGWSAIHDDVIKWKHFPRYWPLVRGIHRLTVNSPHKGQWRGALMLIMICAWINGWVNNREAGDLRHHRAHYDVIVMNIFPLNIINYLQICRCPYKWILHIHVFKFEFKSHITPVVYIILYQLFL